MKEDWTPDYRLELIREIARRQCTGLKVSSDDWRKVFILAAMSNQFCEHNRELLLEQESK